MSKPLSTLGNSTVERRRLAAIERALRSAIAVGPLFGANYLQAGERLFGDLLSTRQVQRERRWELALETGCIFGVPEFSGSTSPMRVSRSRDEGILPSDQSWAPPYAFLSRNREIRGEHGLKRLLESARTREIYAVMGRSISAQVLCLSFFCSLAQESLHCW
jgi:hypothetical protein